MQTKSDLAKVVELKPPCANPLPLSQEAYPLEPDDYVRLGVPKGILWGLLISGALVFGLCELLRALLQ
jgi:hypothetical protein